MRQGAIATLVSALLCGALATSCGDSASTTAEEAARAEQEAAAQAAARAEAEARREAERLAAIWTYADVPVDSGHQVTAALFSMNDVDAGDGARRVQLVFRDHPSWGRTSYLVLSSGDFRCAGRCTVEITADEASPVRMRAHRPASDEVTALFLDDARTLWRTTAGARLLSIAFPVQGGTTTATFEVSGLDTSRLPAWWNAGR